MSLSHKIKFHFLKTVRMLWYSIRYMVYKWKNIEGVAIPVYINYGYSVLRFIDNGEYENSEISIIKNTLDKEDKVLELGTGIGFVSAFCAKQIGSEKVFTYEGNAALAPLIKELYVKNKVNPFFAIALLGTKNGTKTFYKNDDSFLASSSNVLLGEKHKALQVEERDLNEVIKQLKPTYLIMDIEGGEYDIFKIINFQSITKIQFELHLEVLKQEQINSIFEKLKCEGFVKSSLFNFPNNFYFTR
jgi:FkbM family methyltransferase